ncbi:MAG: polyamine aminopropyltransferase [Betaproteobacteria bacterium]|nr:polyamine aminopropyltransferase [Betaproteobacteria bacterium]
MAEDTSVWLVEQMTPDFGFYLRASRLLERVRSPFQEIEVFENPLFGRAMRIDGCFMTSEGDEFFYHEPMVHVPAIAHPEPRSALVVGGGDGGAVEELLKHGTIARVVMAELDQAVIEVSRRWLGAIHGNAFSDPRLDVRVGDGRAFIDSGAERFDLIVLDLTDPFGPAQALYTAEFYAACRRALNPGGVLSLHLESPVHRPQAMARILQSLKDVFALVRPYLVYVPLYGTWWGMATASDAADPLAVSEDEVEARIRARGLERLRFYNGAMHRAVFALPNFVRDLLARPAEPVRVGEPIEGVIDPAALPPLVLAPAGA